MSSGPQLAREIIKRWCKRRRPAPPPRSVRLVLSINGRTFIDIDSRLALAMIDCAFGHPVVNEYEVAPAVPGQQPTRLKLTLLEGGPPEVYPE